RRWASRSVRATARTPRRWPRTPKRTFSPRRPPGRTADRAQQADHTELASPRACPPRARGAAPAKPRAGRPAGLVALAALRRRGLRARDDADARRLGDAECLGGGGRQVVGGAVGERAAVDDRDG